MLWLVILCLAFPCLVESRLPLFPAGRIAMEPMDTCCRCHKPGLEANKDHLSDQKGEILKNWWTVWLVEFFLGRRRSHIYINHVSFYQVFFFMMLYIWFMAMDFLPVIWGIRFLRIFPQQIVETTPCLDFGSQGLERKWIPLLTFWDVSLGIQSPCQMMIGVYNHLLSKVFSFHYHSQKVIGSLGFWIVIQHFYFFGFFTQGTFLNVQGTMDSTQIWLEDEKTPCFTTWHFFQDHFLWNIEPWGNDLWLICFQMSWNHHLVFNHQPKRRGAGIDFHLKTITWPNMAWLIHGWFL